MRSFPVALFALLAAACGGAVSDPSSPEPTPGPVASASPAPPGAPRPLPEPRPWASLAPGAPRCTLEPAARAPACRANDAVYFPGGCPADRPVQVACAVTIEAPPDGCSIWNATPAGYALCCPRACP